MQPVEVIRVVLTVVLTAGWISLCRGKCQISIYHSTPRYCCNHNGKQQPANMTEKLSIPGRIVFIQQPQNVTVSEGADAFFPCSYLGTSGVPSWKINNKVFVTSPLPSRHLYNGSGLVVSNVDLSLNMSSYSCFFTVYINGEFMDIKSNTGFLIIGLHKPFWQML